MVHRSLVKLKKKATYDGVYFRVRGFTSSSVSKISQDPVLCFINHPLTYRQGSLWWEVSQCTRFSEQPLKLRTGADSQAMLQHGQPKLVPSPQGADPLVGFVIEFLDQHGRQILKEYSTSSQLFPISIFRQIGLTTVQCGGMSHGVMEGEFFPGMQRIMMDEDFDGALCREVMGRVFHRGMQPPETVGPVLGESFGMFATVWGIHKCVGVLFRNMVGTNHKQGSKLVQGGLPSVQLKQLDNHVAGAASIVDEQQRVKADEKFGEGGMPSEFEGRPFLGNSPSKLDNGQGFPGLQIRKV